MRRIVFMRTSLARICKVSQGYKRGGGRSILEEWERG